MLDKLVVVGVNHDSASVDLRERIAFAPEKVHESLSALIHDTALSEAVILSTCNRTELYGVVSSAIDGVAAGDQLAQWLALHHEVDINQLLPCVYRNHGLSAASHLVRVAAGLNSMIIGEPQIFGQMKSAFAVAQEAGAVGFHMNIIFREAFLDLLTELFPLICPNSQRNLTLTLLLNDLVSGFLAHRLITDLAVLVGLLHFYELGQNLDLAVDDARAGLIHNEVLDICHTSLLFGSCDLLNRQFFLISLHLTLP